MTLRPILEVDQILFFAVAFATLCGWGYWRVRKEPGGKSRWLRRALLCVLVVVVMVGPSVPGEEKEVISNVEIVFAIDRTGSMAAEDGEGGAPRLEAVREDILSILNNSAGARYAVVTWDSSSRVELPFTTDGSAVQSLAEVLHQEISEFSTGTRIDLPVPTIRDLLDDAAQQRPQNIRFLFVFTDGEDTSLNAPASSGSAAQAWSSLTAFLDGGAVLGYGTEEGGPMRVYRPGGGGEGEFMTDPSSPENPPNEDGVPLAISRIDPDTLEAIATALEVPLLINPSSEQVGQLTAELMKAGHDLEDERNLQHTYRYVTWIPALLAALLVGWELWDDSRQLARLRRTGAI